MRVKEGDKICRECGGVNEHEANCSRQREVWWEVISVYSRAQAIHDGALVDCAQPPFDELNQNVGLRVYVAMPVEAFDANVHPLGNARFPVKIVQRGKIWKPEALPEHAPQFPAGQDMKGRYWDIVWMLRMAMGGRNDERSVLFRFHAVPNSGGSPQLVHLKCVVGPDDEGNPCLTIMLPDQD